MKMMLKMAKKRRMKLRNNNKILMHKNSLGGNPGLDE